VKPAGFDWDDEKDRRNREKHGFGLEKGKEVLDDPHHVLRIDDRFAYGEYRFVAIGMTGDGVLVAVFVERTSDVTRIISVRRAEPAERRRYITSQDW
jgi:uncharacterized DUF497 family protein